MYNYFIFDLYGTLIDLQTNEDKDELWLELATFYRSYNAHYSPIELKNGYINSCKSEISTTKISDYPDIKIENVFSSLYTSKGIVVSNDILRDTALKFRTLSTDFIGLYPGVITLLEYLKSLKKKIILLSNAQRIFTLYELKYTGILDYFDSLYISSDTLISKPDVRFYNIMAKNEKIIKSESVMIGNDHTTDIKGACDFGIDSIYIHSNHSRKNVVSFENNRNIPIIETGSTYDIIDGDVNKIIELLKKL